MCAFIPLFSIPAALKMAPVKRHAYEADFKLNAISHAVQQVSSIKFDLSEFYLI